MDAAHATVIDEVSRLGVVPDVVVLSVGDGGLLCGILEGLNRNNVNNVPVVAVETHGANALLASLKIGWHIAIESITSIATSLGAKKVVKAAYDWCGKHNIASHEVSDIEAVDSCLKFSADNRLLVEPACRASLAVMYKTIEFLMNKENILIIVCGDVGITYPQLDKWQKELG